MHEGWRQFGNWTTGFALATALATAAAAAQPPGTLNEMRGAARGIGKPSISRLDLRAPISVAQPADSSSGSPALGSGGQPFPSAHRPAFEATGAHAEARDEQAWPSFGGRDSLAMARPMSRAEQLARRLQREGLPVARLFESRSALVSLGLNPHGKPGIWLIQKLP